MEETHPEDTRYGRGHVGNSALFYTCAQLSQRHWTPLPTTRNTAGPDILAYSRDGQRRIAIQSKGLSGRSAVPIGSPTSLELCDYLVITRFQGSTPRKVLQTSPRIYIATIDEAKNALDISGSSSGKLSHWIEPRNYEPWKDRWEKIGFG